MIWVQESAVLGNIAQADLLQQEQFGQILRRHCHHGVVEGRVGMGANVLHLALSALHLTRLLGVVALALLFKKKKALSQTDAHLATHSTAVGCTSLVITARSR